MPDAGELLLAELAAVAGALAQASAPVGAGELFASLAETARRIFGAGACSLALLSDDEDELVYTAAAGEGAQEVTGMRLAADRGVAGWVVQSGQPVAVSDLRADPRFARDVAEHTGYVPRAILAVPIASPRGILGVLTLLDRDEARPGAAMDMQLAGVFAGQAALAIETSRGVRDAGRALLRGVAEAARGDGDLAAAARRIAQESPRADRNLAEVATLLAEVGRAGPAEQELAIRVLREVLDWSRGRASRPRN